MIGLLLGALAAVAAPSPAAPPAALDPAAIRVYAADDPGALVSGMTLVVSAGTAREAGRPNGVAALTAQALLLGRVDGVPLDRRVAADGGSIDVVVGPNAVRFTIESLPATTAAVTADVVRAIATPDTSVETLTAARAAIAGEIADGEKNPTTVGMEMLRGSYYQGAAGRPLLGTRESIAAVTAADVAAFRVAHYVRGNAFVTETGVVDAAAAAGARALLGALPAGAEAPATLAVRPIGTAGKRVLTHRDIGVPFVVVGFGAPALGDPDFAPMLVLRALIGDVSDRSDVATAALARGLDVLYAYDVKPATFGISINGALIDPQAALTVVEAIAHNAAARPFNADVVRRYKEVARGQWALEALTLDDREWQVGAAVANGADPAAARGVIAAIDRVTAADVQRVARRYLQRSIIALVLPRGEPSQ